MKKWIKHTLFICLVFIFTFISISYEAVELVSSYTIFCFYGIIMFVLHQLLLRLSGFHTAWVISHGLTMLVLLVFMHTVYWHWWDFLLTAHTARAGLHHLVNFVKSPLPLFIFYIVFLLWKQTRVGYSPH